MNPSVVAAPAEPTGEAAGPTGSAGPTEPAPPAGPTGPAPPAGPTGSASYPPSVANAITRKRSSPYGMIQSRPIQGRLSVSVQDGGIFHHKYLKYSSKLSNIQ